MYQKFRIIGTLILSMLISISYAQKDGWQELFNGKDLNGWKQLNGKAKYEVVDGTIVGTSTLNTPNSFLTTEKNYGDFILELEVWVDNRLNSGIQIRSESKPDYQKGRVHGYQVEIDPSDRAWSGGIYDEARRGWLYPLDLNQPARQAFKKGEWNKYRIEAVGSVIRTFINGVPAAYLIDNLTPEGFICLQVHSINKPEQDGTQVKWRNIRINTTHVKPSPLKGDIRIVNLLPNELSADEKKLGWKLLFDGKDLSQWKGYNVKEFPSGRWTAENGNLIIAKSDGVTKNNDLITRKKYGPAFEFQFEFQLTEAANSGVKYFINETNDDSRGGLGPEYQVLDDKGHPDAKKGIEGNRTLASFYDVKTAVKPNNAVKPIGEWNIGRIVAHSDGTVIHFLNGQKVVEYKRGSEEFNKLVALSKFKDSAGFAMAPKGHLLLQDHHDRVSFRSLKVRQLKK